MNDKYIPEEEEVLSTLPAEADLPPEAPAESAEAAEAELPVETAEESSSGESIPEALPAEDAMPDQISTEQAEAGEIPMDDSAVTEIILETLAEQESDAAATMVLPPMNEAQTEALLDEITQEYTAPSAPVQEHFDDGGAFAQMFEQKAEEPEPEKKERPVRKGRPRRPKGDGLFSIPHLLSAVIWLLIIVAVGSSLGRMIWVCAADVLAFGRESKEVSISITAEDTMESIAEKLHDAGLINIPELFLLYADLADVEEEHKITTGTFTLNTIYDYNALVNHMGPRATNRVVIEDVLIPEGYNCRQIFNLMEERGICKAADLEAYAASGELGDYWFLEGVERGSKYCLEGFLFPDTYDFYENSTPKLVLEKMLDGFEYRFSQELFEQLPVLNERLTEMMKKNGENEEFIAEHQLTLRDLLTVASMIEEETANNAESFRIASVIYNRLFSWGNTPRYLNIDASIIYALDGKTDLTAEDMAVDSPYNTYTHTGLTPGPISNPGLASIQAALNFEDTSYYYYVLNPATGEHQFSKTYEEHQKYVEQFREAANNE